MTFFSSSATMGWREIGVGGFNGYGANEYFLPTCSLRLSPSLVLNVPPQSVQKGCHGTTPPADDFLPRHVC